MTPPHLEHLLNLFPNYRSRDAYHIRVWTTTGLVFQGAVHHRTSNTWLVLDLDIAMLQGVPAEMVNTIKEKVDEDELSTIHIRAEHILTIQLISLG